MENIIAFLLFGIAAIFNGMMDIIKVWYLSTFSNIKDNQFRTWLRSDWQNKYINRNPNLGLKKFFGFFAWPAFMWDGWHAAKTVMLLFITIAILLSTRMEINIFNMTAFLISWFIGFEFSYGYLFRRKEIRKEYFQRFFGYLKFW